MSCTERQRGLRKRSCVLFGRHIELARDNAKKKQKNEAMANSVSPGPVAAAPLENGAPEDAGGTNVPSPASPVVSQRILFVVCGVPLSLVVAAAITFISVYVNERRKNARKPSDADFCCPDEAHELAISVNGSLSPCGDFFAYVCSNVISDALSVASGVHDQLREAMITGVMPIDATMGEAGRFLNTYYQTCVHATLHHESFASSLARALAREMADLLIKPDTRSTMMFCVSVQLRYSLASVVHLSHFSVWTLYLRALPICPLDKRSVADLMTTVRALKGSLSVAVTAKQVVTTAAKLCEHISHVPEARATYRPQKGSSAFSREVWNIDDFHAAVNANGLSLKDVKTIRVRGAKRIRLLYDLFAGDALSGSKAAYLLWHAVVSGVGEFVVESGTASSRVFEICTNSIFILHGLWGLFQAELLTSHEKDVQAKNIFVSVKDAARELFRNSTLFETEDADKLERFFKNVTLLTPMSMSRTDVPVPTATSDFAQNLLNGRVYNLNLETARLSVLAAKRMTRYGEVFLVDDRYLLVSATTYSFIRTGSNNARLPNMALLGQILAESLWAMALRNIEWKSETGANIKRMQYCFVKAYLKDAPRDLDADQVFYSALGLSTVLSALNSTDWHAVKVAWSLWTLSDAQFFYIFGTHQRCPMKSSPGARIRINVPLMYVDDFAKAFSCSSDSSMTKTHRCRVHDVYVPT